jgi:hypothetical protein
MTSDMVESACCIMRLSREMRQRIYDYIVSDTPDLTIKVTMDPTQRNNIYVENGQSIYNLVLTAQVFKHDVLCYLFERFTFVLTDSDRTCRPIVSAFFRALKPVNRVRVQKITIAFFTIHGLFDPLHFVDPSVLQATPQHRWDIINGAQLHPYVRQTLDPEDRDKFPRTEGKLCKELGYSLMLLNQLPGLEHLTLGVDVVEFLAESVIPATNVTAPELPVLISDLTVLPDQVRQGKLRRDHLLFRVLDTVRGLGKLRQVRLELDWRDFVQNKYAGIGLVFGGPWTRAVQEEMETLFRKMVTVCTTSIVADARHNRWPALDFN